VVNFTVLATLPQTGRSTPTGTPQLWLGIGGLLVLFVVRFWREWSVAGRQWRGRIEHVQSGDSATFLTWQQMQGFVHGFGISMEGGNLPSAEDQRQSSPFR
jgi:hypothetical protein